MREQLTHAGEPQPAAIGIDELSIRKGHAYRIVVSALERGQPLWFRGVDRSENEVGGLTTLLAANKRLHTAYILKEQFAQRWTYRLQPWARRFFEQWRAALRWQRLKPFEKFAALIERHWDGIAAYCQPESTVALGFVEDLNNKIRVIQRRCYGTRDEDYLDLKILTCTLPPLPQG